MTAHLHECGHICLSDGSVLRLDLDSDGSRWWARWFVAPYMSLLAYASGPYEQMESVVNGWSDAFELSITSPVDGTGGRPGAVPLLPAPGHNLGAAS